MTVIRWSGDFIWSTLTWRADFVKDRLWFFTSFQFNYNKAMTTVPPLPWLGITEDTDRFRDT